MKRSGQMSRSEQQTEPNNRRTLLSLCRARLFSLLSVYFVWTYAAFSLTLSIFTQFLPASTLHSVIPVYPSLPVCSAASLAAQPPLLNNLVLSSMYRSLRASDSVSLSSNTCCRRSASLLSDDAESSPPLHPPSSLSARPSLFSSLPLPHIHACLR